MSDSNRASASLRQRAYSLHHILNKQLQRESNPHFRSDSPAYWPLYDGAIFCQITDWELDLFRPRLPVGIDPCRHIALPLCAKKPLVFSDKRQSQHSSMQFIWSFHGSRGGTRAQISTWSVLIKAYTNRPFRVFSGGRNCILKIKHAIWIFHSVCTHLHHCLSFPDLLSFLLCLL